MSEIVKYKFVYEGGEAARNRLPAHEGATSIEGFTWSLSLLSHYAATGEIRSRGSLSPLIRAYLKPSRQGSFLQEIWIEITKPEHVLLTSLAGNYAVNTCSQAFNALVVSSFERVCGLISSLSAKEERWLKKLPSGDREALLDKIEPSMKRAHTVIDEGVSTVTMTKGYTPLIKMDEHTKAYVNADLLTDEKIIVASVGAYNANSGNGIVYIGEIGKTVPFFVRKGLDRKTYAALSYSLDQYVNGKPSEIEIACIQTIALDDRIKRLNIERAFKLEP